MNGRGALVAIASGVLTALVALVALGSTGARADQCPNASLEEYLWSRYVLCQDHIARENNRAYIAERFDGAQRLLSVEEAEEFMLAVHAARRGDRAGLDSVIADDLALRIALRGLLAREVYSDEAVGRYCRYKLPPDEPDDLLMPSPLDPEPVQDIDFLLGCIGE